MIVFYKLNKDENSIKFAEQCVEKYLNILRKTNKKNVPKNKALSVKKDTKGKPYIENNLLYLSVSHKKERDCNIIFVAISDKKIGIDCENIRNSKNFKKIVEKYFTEKENEYIVSPYTFLEKWTQKEAIYKANGNGNFLNIDTFKYKDKLKSIEFLSNLIVSIYFEKKEDIYFYNMEEIEYGKNKKLGG